MIWRRNFLGGLLALAPLAALAQEPSLTADNGVAAKVNGEAISTYDLVQRMRLLVMLSSLKPDEATVAWLQRYALTGLINDRLKGQEFERFRRLSELDGDIEDQIKRMAGGDTARLAAALNQAGVQADSLRAYLRGQIAWANLVRGRLGGRVQIGEELAAQEAARLSAPDTAKVRLTGLFVADQSSGERATGLAMAVQLAAQVQGGASLDALAATFSDPSPYVAGVAGRWMLAESLDTEVAAAIAEAPLNAVGKPVEVRDGVLLPAVLERYQPGAGAAPPSIGAAQAGEQLAGDRLTSLASRYLRDLRTSAEIVS
jgi:peptidyl-prolyl cis-trans isomerase SurA